MSNWYYVENNDRVGPVDDQQVSTLITEKKLNADSYVWKKGFENWKKVSEVEELNVLLAEEIPAVSAEVKLEIEKKAIEKTMGVGDLEMPSS